MLRIRPLFIAAFLLVACSAGARSEDGMFEDFETDPASRWAFIADPVMGGVSTGTVAFLREGADAFARLAGTVSTENGGGFIQFRRKLASPPPDDVVGIRVVVRGNNQRYFVHLRTKGTILPWQYYQAAFDTTGTWAEIRLPLSSFEASGWLLRREPAAGTLTSIGVVAYGRDHQAEVDVREIGFY